MHMKSSPEWNALSSFTYTHVLHAPIALDTSKFGYRMLQKMGWTEGKGLGAKEDGGKEHVKVQRKTDSVGKPKSEETSEIIASDVYSCVETNHRPYS